MPQDQASGCKPFRAGSHPDLLAYIDAQIDEMKTYLDCDEHGNLVFRGFLQVCPALAACNPDTG